MWVLIRRLSCSHHPARKSRRRKNALLKGVFTPLFSGSLLAEFVGGVPFPHVCGTREPSRLRDGTRPAVLGVDKSASQRDIQKAFHKYVLLTSYVNEIQLLRCFSYEILSDEEKRKNYDLYGDEKLNPGFGGNYGDEKRNSGFGGNFGNYQGHTTGGPGSSYFTSNQGGWQSMGSEGNGRTFSFAFSGNPSVGGNPFGFGFDLKSGIEELRTLLENFEKKNKVSSDYSKKPSQNEEAGNVPFLTAWNIDNLCGEKAIFIRGIRHERRQAALAAHLWHFTRLHRPQVLPTNRTTRWLPGFASSTGGLHGKPLRVPSAAAMAVLALFPRLHNSDDEEDIGVHLPVA
ncbi:hypothetical protein GW17_00019428 [Ensete ventricosum]|nr:hypothetical protein GW17_00019428 [Ensete ventricosum]